MPKGSNKKSADNRAILEYALQHLEREAAELQAKIDHVKGQLGVSVKPAAAAAPVAAPAAPKKARKERVLSAAARARIAQAQKRRWAAHRKAKAASAKAA